MICPTVFAEFACRSKQIQTKTMTTHGTSITMSIKGGEEEEENSEDEDEEKQRRE